MGIESSGSERIRSALFVDFDNIYIRFKQQYNDDVARSFACNPEQWVAWIERNAASTWEDGRPCCRKLLVRRCYMNPEKFSSFRRKFTLAAFEVIDCPPLTEQGKTSTDMHLVMDVLDTLVHPVHLDEFVILSGDADFTPLLRRLRRHDRFTTIFSAGLASAAYIASCDSMISVDQFISQALGISKVAPTNGAATNKVQAAPPIVPDIQPDLKHGEKAADIQKSSKIYQRKNIKPKPTKMEDLISKIHKTTEIPNLSRDQYSTIFESLACEINSNGFDIDNTSRNVQIQCDKMKISVMEGDIDTVIESCNRADHWFTKGKESAETIAKGYQKYITELCRMKNIKLNEDELELLNSWITGKAIHPHIDALAN